MVLGTLSHATGSDSRCGILSAYQVKGLYLSIDVKHPPRSKEWACSLTFNGKSKEAQLNADMCLLLEEWESRRYDVHSYGLSQSESRKWKDKTLVYYASIPVSSEEPENLPTAERIQKRKEYLTRFVEEQNNDLPPTYRRKRINSLLWPCRYRPTLDITHCIFVLYSKPRCTIYRISGTIQPYQLCF